MHDTDDSDEVGITINKKNVNSVGLVLLGRPLGGEQVEPLLDGDPLSGVLVLWREPASFVV